MDAKGSQNRKDYPLFRNCEKETTSPIIGTIKGSIPSWLQGKLIRVGPGIRKIGNDEFSHVFDGLAILHKISIQNGKTYYTSRSLKSDAYKKNMEANRIVVSEFGTHAHADPCQTLFGRLKCDFKTIGSFLQVGKTNYDITDNCSVNLAYYGDQLYAMTETNFLHRVDPETLHTLGQKVNLEDYLRVNTATAHPHTLNDGTVINIGNSFRRTDGPHYSFIRVPPVNDSEKPSFAKSTVIGEIPCRWKIHSAYFHSFGITNSGKLIFIEYPLCLNLLALALVSTGFMHRSYSDWMTWRSEEKTRFHVISIHDGKKHPVTYETDQLFLFHHINAFEQNGELIVDVAGYNSGDWVSSISASDTIKFARFPEISTARRYVLPLDIALAKPGENLVKLKTTTATAYLRPGKDTTIIDLKPQFLNADFFELPCINYKYNGLNYTYIYGVGQTESIHSEEFGMNTISKIDTVTGNKMDWFVGEGFLASEPVFVADSTKSNPAEDDGVILTTLLKSDQPTYISLVVIDAKTMSEIARSEFTAAGTVTYTLHGIWEPTATNIA